ncbi:hypothetical protein Bca4012_027009 [Brassica carinata]
MGQEDDSVVASDIRFDSASKLLQLNSEEGAYILIVISIPTKQFKIQSTF